eukprot:TRINITY_DN70705_c0_g1_i1.p1 TRINITY_DN70705_c0_g1~~TRINITY_DN70705_c0_g1_i1.p1  ORF type:complete len:161 (+),score=44.96 TRINITY_DN70705_c0_g1_i1:95-577(+)
MTSYPGGAAGSTEGYPSTEEQKARGSASGKPPRAPGKKGAPEPSEADLLCTEFLSLIRTRSKDGLEEALRLSERILELEPGNKMVHEYQVVIPKLIASMEGYIDDAVEQERDPNRTPSEVSSDSDEPASEEEDAPGGDRLSVASEVATEPDISDDEQRRS